MTMTLDQAMDLAGDEPTFLAILQKDPKDASRDVDPAGYHWVAREEDQIQRMITEVTSALVVRQGRRAMGETDEFLEIFLHVSGSAINQMRSSRDEWESLAQLMKAGAKVEIWVMIVV